jgi:hypothetical protein
MPTAMPEFITQTDTLRRLDDALNDSRRDTLRDKLNKPNLTPEALIAAGRDANIFVPADNDEQHVLQDWLKRPAFWSDAVSQITEVLRRGIVEAIDAAKATGLKVQSLWTCHTSVPNVRVAIVKGPQQITLIIDTPLPNAIPRDPLTIHRNDSQTRPEPIRTVRVLSGTNVDVQDVLS